MGKQDYTRAIKVFDFLDINLGKNWMDVKWGTESPMIMICLKGVYCQKINCYVVFENLEIQIKNKATLDFPILSSSPIQME